MLASSWSFARRLVHTSQPLLKGHSKWQNIKATKGKNDMIKSQATNQLLRKVKSSAQRGGFDMKINTELAGLEQEFRKNGLSLDTFKNFLQKMKDRPDQAFQFDVIGPAGSFFIIEAESDNKNKIASALGKYFNKIGGFRVAQDASGVRAWFEAKGVLTVDVVTKDGKKVGLEQMEEIGIELDCEEVQLVKEDDGEKFELTCEPGKVSSVESGLSKQGFSVESAEVEQRPLHPVTLAEADAKKVEKLYEFLQEDEMVTQIYDNIAPE